METEITFLRVNAKERIPEKDGNYITFHKPEGLPYNYVLQVSTRQTIHFLAKEFNKFDVYWLEQK